MIKSLSPCKRLSTIGEKWKCTFLDKQVECKSIVLCLCIFEWVLDIPAKLALLYNNKGVFIV